MADRIRSLADSLRTFDDHRLVELLAARPDLAAPVPRGLSPLAARAATAHSVQQALPALRRPELEVLEALAALSDPAGLNALATACGSTPDAIGPALDRLRTLALVWGEDPVHAVRTVRSVLATPAGLAPPAAGDPDVDCDAVRRMIADDPEQARNALQTLAWGPPMARTDPDGPLVAPLIARGLLRRADEGTVTMPRSVQLALREGRVICAFEPEPPALTGSGRAVPAAGAAAAAADAAFEALRISSALSFWDDDPPGVLRRGGLAQRDLRRLASRAETTPGTYATVAEACWGAGLIGHDGQAWRLTRDWDDFRERPVPERWAELAVAWLRSSRIPSLAGTDDGHGQPRPALSEATARDGAKTRRQLMLRLLCEADPATGPVAAAELAPAVHWYFPLVRRRLLEQEVNAFVTEAHVLGLLGAGLPSAPARRIIRCLPDDPVAALADGAVAFEASAPAPVDRIVLQSDLVAVVPGRPTDDLAAVLHWTEPVSRGGALVVRFTPASVRRALMDGRDLTALRDLLEHAGDGPVPQPLLYLLADEERKLGQVRVGRTSAYLVADPAVLDAVEADSTTRELMLRRLAPTVLISAADPGFVLQSLRSAGLSPVPEGPDGALLRVSSAERLTGGTAEDEHSSPLRSSAPALALPPAEAVRRLREADADGGADASTTDRLLTAIAEGERLTLGIVDGRGGITARDCVPLGIEAGRLRARDTAGDSEFTVLVQRVTLE